MAGVSGGGKSTLVTGILERLTESGFQFCVIDPEGDYSELEGAVVLGDARQQPTDPGAPGDPAPAGRQCRRQHARRRPRRPADLLRRASDPARRSCAPRPAGRTGSSSTRPIISCPPSRPAALTLPRELQATILVTVHPDQLAPEVLATVETVAAVGDAPARTIRQFCTALGRYRRRRCPETIGSRQARLCSGSAARAASRSGFGWSSPSSSAGAMPASTARASLVRTAASIFAAPTARCPFASRTCSLFLQIAAGVDDRTWLHHLRAGDYSAWIRDAIKDEDLADEFAAVERDPDALGRGQPRSDQGGDRPPLYRAGLGGTQLTVWQGCARPRTEHNPC